MDPALWELLEEGSGDEEVAAIIRLHKEAELPDNIRIVAQFGEIATCRLRRSAIQEVHADETVFSLKAPRLSVPDLETPLSPDLEAATEFIPAVDQRRLSHGQATGKGVVVGVLDWGIDFAHPDFLHPDGTTRLLRLWDQRGVVRGSDNPYG